MASQRKEKRLGEIEGLNSFSIDAQEIQSCIDSIGYLHVAQHVMPSRVTGVVAQIEDGEYIEVWMTEWSRPYELDTKYYLVKERGS